MECCSFPTANVCRDNEQVGNDARVFNQGSRCRSAGEGSYLNSLKASTVDAMCLELMMFV